MYNDEFGLLNPAYNFHYGIIYSCSAHRKSIQVSPFKNNGGYTMMYIDNEVLEKMIMTMVEGFDRLEKKLDRMNRLKDCLDGDTLLDNCDLAQLLGVTQRTIARYREKGLIRYYQTDENGKNFYRSSEIQDFLRQRGKKK